MKGSILIEAILGVLIIMVSVYSLFNSSLVFAKSAFVFKKFLDLQEEKKQLAINSNGFKTSAKTKHFFY